MDDIDRADTYSDEETDQNLAAMAVRVMNINEDEKQDCLKSMEGKSCAGISQ